MRTKMATKKTATTIPTTDAPDPLEKLTPEQRVEVKKAMEAHRLAWVRATRADLDLKEKAGAEFTALAEARASEEAAADELKKSLQRLFPNGGVQFPYGDAVYKLSSSSEKVVPGPGLTEDLAEELLAYAPDAEEGEERGLIDGVPLVQVVRTLNVSPYLKIRAASGIPEDLHTRLVDARAIIYQAPNAPVFKVDVAKGKK